MEEKKIISIEDRIPKLKEARKKKANRRLIYYLSILFLIILFIIYLQSPLSNVKMIEIEGNEYVNDEEVLLLTGLHEETNIWDVRSGKLEEALLDQPLIKEASITRKLPQTIQISIEEYPIVGFIENNSEYEMILPNGNIIKMEDGQVNLAGAPLLKGFDDRDLLKQMATELNETDKEVFHLISEVVWQGNDKNQLKVLLYMNDGFIVDIPIRQFAMKMEDYPSIVAQIEPEEKGIIHMGVGTYFESLK